jgi:hypothetical protein
VLLAIELGDELEKAIGRGIQVSAELDDLLLERLGAAAIRRRFRTASEMRRRLKTGMHGRRSITVALYSTMPGLRPEFKKFIAERRRTLPALCKSR